MSYNKLIYKILFTFFVMIFFTQCFKERHPDYKVNSVVNATKGFLFEIIDNNIFHIKKNGVIISNMLGKNSNNFININSQTKIVQKDSNKFILVYGKSNMFFDENSISSHYTLNAVDYKVIDSLVYYISNESQITNDGKEEKSYKVWLNVLKNNDLARTSRNEPLFEHKNRFINYAFFQKDKLVVILNKNTLQLISANKNDGFKFINFPLNFELNLFSANITTKDNFIILSSNNQTRIFELVNNNLILKSVIE